MLELYVNDLSPFTRSIELQLQMKGVDFTRTAPERAFVREGGFGDINPIRKIPVLVVDGVVIAESRAISELIEELYPTPPLLPEAPLDRARVRTLAAIAGLYFAGPMVQLFGNRGGNHSRGIEADATAMMARGVKGLDRWVASGPYAAGEMRTIADCALAPALFFLDAMRTVLEFKNLPDLGDTTKAYFEAVQRDADVARCVASMDASLKKRFAPAQ